MTQPTDRPGIDQLRNLADRAERGPLTADEAARLRDGIAKLHGWLTTARAAARAERAEAERDMLGRETDRLRKDWVEMRTRAERAEAARAEEKADNDALREILLRGGYKPRLDQAEATLTTVRDLATNMRDWDGHQPAVDRWATDILNVIGSL